jgi:hypothetical protein
MSYISDLPPLLLLVVFSPSVFLTPLLLYGFGAFFALLALACHRFQPLLSVPLPVPPLPLALLIHSLHYYLYIELPAVG